MGKIQSSRAKKTIAIVAAIILLLTGAVTGVTMFLKDDGTAQAASDEKQITYNQNAYENSEPIAQEQTQEPETNLNAEEINNQGETETTALPDENDNVAQAATGTTITSTTITEAITRDVVAQPTEYITYRDTVVSEDFLVGWTSISLPSIILNTGKGIYKPNIEIEKKSYTESDMVQEDGSFVRPEESKYNSVAPGEIIVYEVKVSNTGNLDAKNVEIYDSIPDGTTFIQVRRKW